MFLGNKGAIMKMQAYYICKSLLFVSGAIILFNGNLYCGKPKELTPNEILEVIKPAFRGS